MKNCLFDVFTQVNATLYMKSAKEYCYKKYKEIQVIIDGKCKLYKKKDV